MFIDSLDAHQKDILVRVLCEVAQADRIVNAEERETITRYALSLGMTPSQLETALQSAEPVALETLRDLSETAKRVVLIEAQTLAMIDGEFGEAEVAVIADLAARLVLEPTVVAQIDIYVRHGFDWVREGVRIVQGEESLQPALGVG